MEGVSLGDILPNAACGIHLRDDAQPGTGDSSVSDDRWCGFVLPTPDDRLKKFAIS